MNYHPGIQLFYCHAELEKDIEIGLFIEPSPICQNQPPNTSDDGGFQHL
jgi:hypothetical protein